jgi:hypothetical protein
MKKEQKIKLLERLLEKSEGIQVRNKSDPEFKSWKNMVERTLSNIYGENSKELKQFTQLRFSYFSGITVSGVDYSQDHLYCFNRDFETAIKTISSLVEEIKDFEDEADSIPNTDNYERVFISHSSEDKSLVEELVDILESIGLASTQIFCSSLDGYGIPIGNNPIETLKNEINKNVLVLFVLTENFYKSQFCLFEMGATWALSKEHIPIVVPPFTFDEMNKKLQLSQGILINDELKLNLLREKLAEMFNLSQQPMSSWERKRDRTIGRINKILETTFKVKL